MTDEPTPDRDADPHPASPPALEAGAKVGASREAARAADDGGVQDGALTALRSAATSIADAATSIAAAPVRSVARPILREVDQLASGARRRIASSDATRVRRVRRMARDPLPQLWELHPEARSAGMRELGLQTVPVDRIRGSAVEGPDQRGGDFLPIRPLRGDDWNARWQRILSALDQLVNLPPVDLLKLGDEYWVVDGHNRVAAALYNGQVGIDANVVQLRPPGSKRPEHATRIAPYLMDSRELRDAGSGRRSATAVRPDAIEADLLEHESEVAETPAGERPPTEDR